MTNERKNDWQVYVAICNIENSTTRDVALKLGIPIGEALSSIRRLAVDGLVHNGGIEDGRTVLHSVSWNELFDENKIIEMFGINKDEIYANS